MTEDRTFSPIPYGAWGGVVAVAGCGVCSNVRGAGALAAPGGGVEDPRPFMSQDVQGALDGLNVAPFFISNRVSHVGGGIGSFRGPFPHKCRQFFGDISRM